MIASIQELPLMGLLFALAVCSGLAGAAIYAALRARKVAQIVAAMTTSNLATAAPGYREFVGKVESINGKLLKAPLTGVDCCWYRAKVEEYRQPRSSGRDSDSSPSWVSVKSSSSYYPFLMRDGSGVCAVHPMLADITPTDRAVWYGPSLDPVDKSPQRLKQGEVSKAGFQVLGTANTRFRYTEECMYANDPLFALGQYGIAGSKEDEDDDFFADDDDSEPWFNRETYKSLVEESKQITRCFLACGSSRKKEPFVLAAATQEHFLQMNRSGSKALFILSLIPLSIAGFLLWARFLA